MSHTPYPFPCHDCGELIHKPEGTIAAGYAILPNSEARICYACADKREVADLLKPGPFVAYVSSDGKRVTTWTGGTLMRITQSWSVKLTRFSHTHGKSILHVRAVDVHGQHWYGRGSPGIVIKLRRNRSK